MFLRNMWLCDRITQIYTLLKSMNRCTSHMAVHSLYELIQVSITKKNIICLTLNPFVHYCEQMSM